MPRKRQGKSKKDVAKQESDSEEETSKPSLVNLPEEELAPFTLDDMGTLLARRPEPLPEVGGLRGTRKDRMHETLAAFADVALESSGYFNELLLEAERLEQQSSENRRIAFSAFHEACRTLGFPSDWTTNRVMDELRKLYVEKNQTASDAEKDLGHKTQDAHRAQDIDNGMNTLRGVLNEFRNQLPPGLTISKIDSCLELLQSILRQLEGASKERKVDYFPDGQNWKLILNSFYLYSFGGMIYEARMIDQEITFTKKEQAPGSTPETMFDLIKHYRAVLKGGDGENTISPRRFALRKAVCEKVREARMILHSVGVSDEVKLEKIKQARKSVIEFCQEFEKVDAAILASRKNHDDRCTAHQASHQSTSRPHLPPSASLAHVPVSRRLNSKHSFRFTA